MLGFKTSSQNSKIVGIAKCERTGWFTKITRIQLWRNNIRKPVSF